MSARSTRSDRHIDALDARARRARRRHHGRVGAKARGGERRRCERAGAQGAGADQADITAAIDELKRLKVDLREGLAALREAGNAEAKAKEESPIEARAVTGGEIVLYSVV